MHKLMTLLLGAQVLLAPAHAYGEVVGADPTIQPNVAPEVAPAVGPSVAPQVAPEVGPAVGPSVAPRVAPEVAPTVTIAPEADFPLSDATVQGAAGRPTIMPIIGLPLAARIDTV